MKIFNLFVFLTCIFLAPKAKLSSQCLTVVYQAKSINNGEYFEKKDASETLYWYSLMINKNLSKYSRDSLMILNERKAKDTKEIWTIKNIYKDYSNDLYVEENGRFIEGIVTQKRMSTKFSKNKTEWIITAETKMISGIKCKKAVTSIDTAWFATSLNYLDGPQNGVFDLPGLVLYYKSMVGEWKAESLIYDCGEIEIPTQA